MLPLVSSYSTTVPTKYASSKWSCTSSRTIRTTHRHRRHYVDNTISSNTAFEEVSAEVDLQPRDVVGVVGTLTSMQATSVAQFFGIFQLPIMSIYATSDALSDKTRYEYVMRLAPPDSIEEATLVKVLLNLGCSYISLVYTDSSYGQNATDQVEQFLRDNPDYGTCLAVSVKIPNDAGRADFDIVVGALMAEKGARVVMAFVSFYQQTNFFDAVRCLVRVGWFLWLSGDAMAGTENDQFMDMFVGGIYTNWPRSPVPGFEDYMINANQC